MTNIARLLLNRDALLDNFNQDDNDRRQSLRSWLELLKCAKLIDQIITTRFCCDFGTSLTRFDVLAQLDHAGSKGLTTSELAGCLLASRGNITRLLDRMEQAGLIRRHSDPGDRRITYIRLTRRGAKLFERMTPVHAAWVNRVFNTLDESELDTLTTLLQRVRHHAQDIRHTTVP